MLLLIIIMYRVAMESIGISGILYQWFTIEARELELFPKNYVDNRKLENKF